LSFDAPRKARHESQRIPVSDKKVPIWLICLAVSTLSWNAEAKVETSPEARVETTVEAKVEAKTDAQPPPKAGAPAPTSLPASAPAVVKPSQIDRKQVYLLWYPTAKSNDFLSVLTRMAQAKLNALPQVTLKQVGNVPQLRETIEGFGKLEHLDRVSLINIKNQTGFDGLVHIAPTYRGNKLALAISYVDFRNGEFFRERALTQLIDAELFQTLEADLVEFATRIRRSYRVTLKVDAHPEGSEVYINGKLAGKTPLVKEVKAGAYKIAIRKRGFRDFRQNFQLTNGDILRLRATLYNPIAARYLNAKPGLRLDSRLFNLGYRYVYVGADQPALEHLHFFSLEGSLRIRSLDLGLRFGLTSPRTQTPLDTFLGSDQGSVSYETTLMQFQAVGKYVLWEKFSFASLRICTAHGFSYGRTSINSGKVSAWSYSGDVYAEVVSRLFRSGNFSMELQLDVGFSYAGKLPYKEKTFSVFGEGAEVEKSRHLFGPMAALALRFNFFNDIF
jgi:hypothetical protein